MKDVFFSIIVPFYNVENFIRDCCISLKNQSFSNFEAIFIDDGSKDKSREILEKEIINDPRFKIISQENAGLPEARNNGMSYANGEYLVFVDSDDFVSVDLLKELNSILSICKYEVVQFNHNLVNLNGKLIKKFSLREKYKKIYGKDLIENNPFNVNLIKNNCFVDFIPNCWTRCYSREFLIKNKIKFPNTLFEDSVFSNKVLVKAEAIFYIDKNLYNYRSRDGSIMNSKTTKVLDIFKNITNIRVFLEENNLNISFKKQLDNYELFQVATAVACLPPAFNKKFDKECRQNMSIKQYLSIKYLIFPQKSILRFFSIFYWLYKLNKHKWKWIN